MTPWLSSTPDIISLSVAIKRQLHKATILKGGIRKANQAEKYVCGFRLYDKVLYNGIECFVWGRRTSGSLGIDPGRTNIGAAVVREDGECMFTAQLTTRNKNVPLLYLKKWGTTRYKK